MRFKKEIGISVIFKIENSWYINMKIYDLVKTGIWWFLITWENKSYIFPYVIVLIIIDSYNIFYLRYIDLNLLYFGIASGWLNTESTWNCLDVNCLDETV